MKKFICNWIVPFCTSMVFVSMGYVDNIFYDICASILGFMLMDIYAMNYDKYN